MQLQSIFGEVRIALRIFCTLPVTVAGRERAFSKLNIIKIFMRSTMSQERLNNLATLLTLYCILYIIFVNSWTGLVENSVIWFHSTLPFWVIRVLLFFIYLFCSNLFLDFTSFIDRKYPDLLITAIAVVCVTVNLHSTQNKSQWISCSVICTSIKHQQVNVKSSSYPQLVYPQYPLLILTSIIQ